MELTFVHQYSGDTPKRRRLAKACETCRARKKRCVHFTGADRPDATNLVDDDGDHMHTNGETNSRMDSAQRSDHISTSAAVPATGDTPAGVQSATSQQHTPPHSAGGKRFVSDLNPAATLLDRPREDARGQLLPNDDIGIWIDKLEYDELVKHRNIAAAAEDHNSPKRPTPRDVSRSTYAYGLPGDQRPHSAVLGPLIDAYFERINPILPLIDEADFREQYATGDVPEPLVHALCLVAAKDTKAAVHLRLQASPSTLPPREFCTRLHASVMGALRAPCQYDKTMLIRILALASLHSEGPDGSEEASMLLSQAMHHAQTMAIHLGQQSNTQSNADLSMKRLFWCLWVLDRINSVINGRPVIMSDIDIAIDRFKPGESGFPAFEAWLKVTEMLNKIITFYRPHYPLEITGWEDVFPGMEEILDEVQGWQLSPSLHMTLHLYYLTVAVLSHRSRGIKQIPRGTNSAIRQRLCASEIVRLLESDRAACGLHALPFIPYSASVALSVAYQHLRQSQFLHQQEDACEEFRKCTKILQNLRRTWSSADTMAALARKVQDEIDRAPSLVCFRITREAQRRAAEASLAEQAQDRPPCAPDITGQRTGLLETADALHDSGVDGAQLNAANAIPTADQQASQDGMGLFDGMDDVFGTYLDPNYPVNLDDLSFLDDLQPFDYNNSVEARWLGT